MTRNRRNLILVAGLVALVAVGAAVAVGIALGGDDDHKPRYPGRIAVRDGCGLVHFFQDGSDQRTLCLTGRLGCGQPLLEREEPRLGHEGDGASGSPTRTRENEFSLSVPQGANFGPSLSPDGKKVAFLHSARDDGRYDIWVGDVDANNAEQVTNTRNVSDVVWSPEGRLARVRPGLVRRDPGGPDLARASRTGAATRRSCDGDTPEWAPDGKHLVYFHNGSIWTIGSDGKDAKRIVPNGHSPAWSRDGEQIAFMRAERCGSAVVQGARVPRVREWDRRAPDRPGLRGGAGRALAA